MVSIHGTWPKHQRCVGLVGFLPCMSHHHSYPHQPMALVTAHMSQILEPPRTQLFTCLAYGSSEVGQPYSHL